MYIKRLYSLILFSPIFYSPKVERDNSLFPLGIYTYEIFLLSEKIGILKIPLRVGLFKMETKVS